MGAPGPPGQKGPPGPPVSFTAWVCCTHNSDRGCGSKQLMYLFNLHQNKYVVTEVCRLLSSDSETLSKTSLSGWSWI